MRARLTCAALAALSVGAARAGAEPPCSASDHTLQRAGNPQCVAWYAVPGRSPKDALGYVGGGCLGRKGGPRDPLTEGILGWDYAGCGWYPGRVFLNWCHGKERPTGPYSAEGPHVPDVFSVRPILRAVEAKEHHGAEH